MLTINLTDVASTSGGIGYIPYQVSPTKFGNSPLHLYNGDVYYGAYKVATLNDITGSSLTLAQVLANGNDTGAAQYDIVSNNAKTTATINNGGWGLIYGNGGIGENSSISGDVSSVNVDHDTLINLTAPSVKKNGVEIATTSDLSAYEPYFVKNTAFNKNFGTSSGDILLQTGTTANQVLVTDANNKVTSQAKGTAFNRNFGTSSGDILLLGSSTVASQLMATDANNQVQTLTTTTYPNLTELSYVKGVTSAIQTQLNTRGEYVILTGNSFNPADGATYYLGTWFLAPSATTAQRQFQFTNPGTVTSVQFYVFNTSANGSNDAVTIYLRNETAGTETSLGTNTWDAGLNTIGVTLFSCSISVPNNTDRWSLKIVCPTWGTNPTGTYLHARIFNRT